MSGAATYKTESPLIQWLERRLPIVSLVYSSFVAYPTPRNLNYWWTFGGILTFMLGVQMITGIVLAMHYTPHVDLAFNSVEDIMRDVNYGWLLRYIHANGASFFSWPSISISPAACITAPTRSRAKCCGSSASSCSC